MSQVTRPDGKNESLGLSVLDEPAAKQSDPSVLELQLRAISKQSSAKAAQVHYIMIYMVYDDIIWYMMI